jgi:hypothetical protein
VGELGDPSFPPEAALVCEDAPDEDEAEPVVPPDPSSALSGKEDVDTPMGVSIVSTKIIFFG